MDFFYNVKYETTNRYDGNPLHVVGRVEVFNDEAKTIKLTEIPFSNLGLYIEVSECPIESKEVFEEYINVRALQSINEYSIQVKLLELKNLYEIGLLEIL